MKQWQLRCRNERALFFMSDIVFTGYLSRKRNLSIGIYKVNSSLLLWVKRGNTVNVSDG